MRDIRARLASLSLSLPLLAAVGLAAGCGDNTPKPSTGTGGTTLAGQGGNGGHGTGGSGQGGSAGAGATDGGSPTDGSTDAVTTPCYTTAFTAPVDGATLTVADDTGNTCADGFQYNVKITSAAPDGTDVTLYDGTQLLMTVKVSGGAATFANVQLSIGSTAQTLRIQYPTTATCTVSELVTVNCPNNPPSCAISKPVISATHPDLNGVASPTGDRTSSAGSPYQATFVVTTNAEDGQAVTLAVDSVTTGTDAGTTSTPVDGTPSANVSGGAATFGLTLSPDGTYEVVATCKNKEGITSTSTKSTFTVDTTPPTLTVSSPTAGQFISTLDANGAFKVCAQTTSPDAAGLAASLGAGQSNLCASAGAATPVCGPVATVSTDACVSVTCPGAAPFALTVTLKDAAGNPQTQTISGVSCASSAPTVQIVAPASDAPGFTDPSKHILAATAPTGILDKDPTTPGAQVDVVACTDTAGTAVLKVGHQGDTTLTALGSPVTTVAAVAGDNCPTGLGNVARFSSVTLPESTEGTDGKLTAATQLVVTLTSAANSAAVGTSAPDNVWVDTTPPSLALSTPANLCGSFTQSASAVTDNLAYTADYSSVSVQVTNNGTTTTYNSPAFVGGVATFANVAFIEGLNNIVTSEFDPAGNETTLATCGVTIGSGPVVTFTTPTAANVLCPAGATSLACIDDNDTGDAGWQGSLAVSVKASGVPVAGSVVTFTQGSTTLGTATTDAGGTAQINAITLPEGSDTIVATTDNVPNAGVGTGSVTVVVDTTPPNAPTGINVSITDRRKTAMQLTWTAPSDGNGNAVAGYQVRYAKVPITAANFNDTTVTTAVSYTGTPTNPGQIDGLTVSPLYIENGYYFAVEAVDAAGTVSTPPLATTAATTAHFNVTKLVSGSTANEGLGFAVSAEGDVNNDGLSDILVGTVLAGRAYLFLGSSTVGPVAPSVTFTGSATSFGLAVAQIGDIDNDGLPDIAIADSTNRQVYIYKGRTTWPATLADSNADYVISGADASYAGALLGSSLARLGDFTGDGIDDFAIGARGFNANVGRVVIIPGKATGFASVSLPDPANSIVIDGDSTLGTGTFGYRVLGVGRFYSATGGTTLIASAPGRTATAPSVIYAFHGQAGSSGVIPLASADNTFSAPSGGMHLGEVLENLGGILGASVPAVGLGNPVDNVSGVGGNGTAYLMYSPQGTGPFAKEVILDLPGTNQAGGLLIGGGLTGGGATLSLIGDSTPDIVFGAKTGTNFTIFDGALLGSKTSPISAATSAEIVLPMPGGTGEGEGSIMTDVNGDKVPDFCIGTGVAATVGSVAVYW